MSDHGDYKEPKVGDWMLVVHQASGAVVDCVKVDRIEDLDDANVAILYDGSAWGAETGQPLRRAWVGHYLWPITKTDDYDAAVDMLSAASPEAFATAYAILLRDKRERASKADEATASRARTS